MCLNIFFEMLWCAEKHVKTIDELTHHKDILSKLLNISYINLQNLFFHGIEGSGKKTIVFTWLNYIIIKYFNLQLNDIKVQERYYIHKTNKKECKLTYETNMYYIHVDLAKLGKKIHILFDNVLEHLITKRRNIHNLPFNLLIFSNFDTLDDKMAFRFHKYMDKYSITTRFICITNNSSITRHHKITNFANIRIRYLYEEELLTIIKYILNKYLPNINTQTKIFKDKFKKILELSKNNLAKTIFYTQLVFEYGMVSFKNIALREHKTMKYLFSLITSNNIKNLQDMNKIKNTTKIKTYNTLKLRELVYQCSMGIDNYAVFIRKFYTYILKYQPEFVNKYNNVIIKLIHNICNSETTTNKTTFILTECFFIKLMAIYSLDKHGISLKH